MDHQTPDFQAEPAACGMNCGGVPRVSLSAPVTPERRSGVDMLSPRSDATTQPQRQVWSLPRPRRWTIPLPRRWRVWRPRPWTARRLEKKMAPVPVYVPAREQ